MTRLRTALRRRRRVDWTAAFGRIGAPDPAQGPPCQILAPTTRFRPSDGYVADQFAGLARQFGGGWS